MKSDHLDDLAARVARLTAGQREVLALVTDHATSKEIARVLGISPHTVDARMRAALQTLKVASRREAAVIYRAAMAAEPDMNPYQLSAYQASRLADEAGEDDNEPQDDDRDEAVVAAPPRADTVFEARVAEPAMGADAALWAPVHVAPGPQFRLWGGVNDLTKAQRIIAIVVIMVLAMLAFGMLLSGMEALSELRTGAPTQTAG